MNVVVVFYSNSRTPLALFVRVPADAGGFQSSFLFLSASFHSSSITPPVSFSLSHGILRDQAPITMASVRSVFGTFFALVILLCHLGCFIFVRNDRSSAKKRKVSPVSTSTPSPPRSKSHKTLSSSWTFLRSIFSFKYPNNDAETHFPSSTLSSARPSQHSIVSIYASPSAPPRKRSSLSRQEPDISFDHPSFPLRNDIFPCPACGEIFLKPQLLEQHQSFKHAVSELLDGDSGKNIVRIIFSMGWNDKERKSPTIHRILKIHNGPKIMSSFEEHRECVKSKAARSGGRRRDERCVADGNELLRFQCSTFVCNLGQNGNSSICNQQYCGVCGIIRSGFSPKMDGISTFSTSWTAHAALPYEIEKEFAFLNVKRAMLVCRVIAGRIGCDLDKDEMGFDSVVGRSGGVHPRLDEDELVVFDPRAVLPCFVIVYSV